MRTGRFSANGGPPRFGIFEDDRVVEVSEPFAVDAAKGMAHDLTDIKLLAPVDRPSKVICVGINYVPHMEESGFERQLSP
jgi:2-keto-4-pentenoate hydratase/2-oxohepta-3-ene-1,7-dioic acid hydratase in catechol pathway